MTPRCATPRGLREAVGTIGARAGDLVDARQQGFAALAETDAAVAGIFEVNTRISERLVEIGDDAYFNMVMGGEAASGRVKTTLEDLVDRDFARLSDALALRVEVNVLRGAALAMVPGLDVAGQAIVRDSVAAGESRMQDKIVAIEPTGPLAPLRADLARLAGLARDLARPGSRDDPQLRQQIQSLATKVDLGLGSAVDDLAFALTLNAIEAGKANATTIDTLLTRDVAPMIEAARIEARARDLVASALRLALSRSLESYDRESAALEAARAVVAGQMAQLPPDLRPLLRDLLDRTDPARGWRRRICARSRRGPPPRPPLTPPMRRWTRSPPGRRRRRKRCSVGSTAPAARCMTAPPGRSARCWRWRG
ncbi:hypothetical protein ACTTAM_07485 [Rhodobacter capsulatus]|uniref:hypothetical protein n=1 Tax=Rhodobacter capsulatus TaxID=1061 RepID=UPI004027A397